MGPKGNYYDRSPSDVISPPAMTPASRVVTFRAGGSRLRSYYFGRYYEVARVRGDWIARLEGFEITTRLGGLPAPTGATADFVPGNGKACDGCGDIITTAETLYSVNLRGVVHLRFHHECYVAWSTYTPGGRRVN